MNIEITSITILRSKYSSDKLILKVDLPPSYFPWSVPPTLQMDAAADTGEEYCTKAFPGVPIEIVRMGGE